MLHHMHFLRRVALGMSVAGLACVVPAASAQDMPVSSQGVFIQALPTACANMASPAAAGDAQRVVTGVPYSATGRSETVQTLADGNRIVRSNTIRYFRDGRGRTRTEYLLSAVGPIALQGASSLVVIDDPAAAKRIMLHPEMKMATEMPRMECGVAAAGEAAAGAVTFMAAAPVPAPAMGNVVFAAPSSESTTSALPERSIRGLRAVGKRSEASIPAEQVGNEMPIVVRSETWYSPELQVVLSATHRDPLFGDTTYQLVDIVRKEPDAKLFAIPRDYTLRTLPEGPQFEMALPKARRAN